MNAETIDKQSTFFSELIGKRRLEGDSEYQGGQRDSILLWHAIQDEMAGDLKYPPHQRRPSWPEKKQLEYIETICNDSTPPGCFEIYQLYLENRRLSVKWLNDGSQRLRTAKDFYLNPDRYGVTKEDALYILKNTSYPFTLKKHRSHQEALIRFQTVNNNVPLTSYQITIGDIVYCTGSENYEQWQDLVDKLHNRVRAITTRIADKPEPGRDSKYYLTKLHVMLRHDLSLFLRYINNDKSFRDYEPNIKLDISSGRYFEKELAIQLARIGIDEALEKLEAMLRMMELEVSTMEGKWHDIRKDGGHFIRTSMVRWLLDCAIWRRANNIPSPIWERFIDKLLKQTNGLTVLKFIADGKPNRMNVTISRVKDLSSLGNVIGVDLVGASEYKRDQLSTDGMRSGWHNSHVKPFKDYGNGDTFREPGSINMSRGARPVGEVGGPEADLDDEDEDGDAEG